MRMYALGKYIQLFFFPYSLTSSYFYNDFPFVTFFEMRSLLSLSFYLIMIIGIIKYFRSKNVLVFSGLYYLITLSVYAHIFVLVDIVGERFLFIPSLGLCILCTELFHRKSNFEFPFHHNLKMISLLSVIIILLSTKTITRNNAWKSNLTLARTDLKTSPQSHMLHAMMGMELFERAGHDQDKLKATIPYFTKALELNPHRYEAWSQFGRVYLRLGNLSKAQELFKKATELSPGYLIPKVLNAKIYNQKRQPGKALAILTPLEKNIEDPGEMMVFQLEVADAHNQLAHYDQAALAFKKTIQAAHDARKTDRLDALHYNLAVTYLKQNALEQALESYEKSIKINPKFANAYDGMGSILFQKKSYDKAIQYSKKALELNPRLLGPYKNLINYYNQVGDTQASKHYSEKLKWIMPSP